MKSKNVVMRTNRCAGKRLSQRVEKGMAGLLGAVAFLTMGVAANAQTIDEAMAEAIRTHPAVKAEAFEAQAAERQIGAARSGYFPTIALDGSVRREKSERLTTDRTLTAEEYSLTLTQPLFDGFNTSSRVAAAKSDAAAENFETKSELNNTAFDAAQAYLRVLEARELVSLLKRNEDSALRIANRISKRAEADRGLRSLIVVGNSETEEARFLVLEAERELVLAETRYRELVGAAPENLQAPVEPLEVVSLTSEVALDRASQYHPALSAVRARALAADGERKAARSDLFPHLDAELKARNGRNIEGVTGPDDDYYAGLRLTYRFATGGRDFYNYSAAELREKAADIRIQDVARKVRLDVLDALETYHSSRDMHSVLMRRRMAASETVKVYDQQFVGGQRDLLDLFFVLNEERTAYRAELEARIAKLRSAYRLLAAMGELGPMVVAAK
jgi:adhesin transport system outer membrane protein